MNALHWIPAVAFLSLLALGDGGQADSAPIEPPRAPECDLEHPCFHMEVCAICADGSMSCASAECVDGRCRTIPPCSRNETRRKTAE